MLKARIAFGQNVTKNVAFRKVQLKSLIRFLDENKQSLIEALHKDIRKVWRLKNNV